MTRTSRRSVLVAIGVGFVSAERAATSTDDPGGSDTGHTAGTTASPSAETTLTGPPSPTETTVSGGETTWGDGTTDDWLERASNTPYPDHSISLYNAADETRTVRTWVVRERTDETVFETMRAVPAEASLVVYNLRQVNPEGIEAFRICGELIGRSPVTTDPTGETPTIGGTRTVAETRTTSSGETTTASESRDCATIETSECFGDAFVTVTDDDSLELIYAIC